MVQVLPEKAFAPHKEAHKSLYFELVYVHENASWVSSPNEKVAFKQYNETGFPLSPFFTRQADTVSVEKENLKTPEVPYQASEGENSCPVAEVFKSNFVSNPLKDVGHSPKEDL